MGRAGARYGSGLSAPSVPPYHKPCGELQRGLPPRVLLPILHTPIERLHGHPPPD